MPSRWWQTIPSESKCVKRRKSRVSSRGPWDGGEVSTGHASRGVKGEREGECRGEMSMGREEGENG